MQRSGVNVQLRVSAEETFTTDTSTILCEALIHKKSIAGSRVRGSKSLGR